MKRIWCKHDLPNETIEASPGIVDHAVDMIVRKLTEEFEKVLCTHEEYIVRMEVPTITDGIMNNTTECRSFIEYAPLVRCGECKHRKRGNRHCVGRRYDWFCADGERESYE